MIAVQPTQHRGATPSRDIRAWHKRLFPVSSVALEMRDAAPGIAFAPKPHRLLSRGPREIQSAAWSIEAARPLAGLI
jgi:hypothetical protein